MSHWLNYNPHAELCKATAEQRGRVCSAPSTCSRDGKGECGTPGTSGTARTGKAAPARAGREPKAAQGAGQSGDLQRTRRSALPPRWLPLLGTPLTATSPGTLRQAQTDTGPRPGGEGDRGHHSLPEALRAGCSTKTRSHLVCHSRGLRRNCYRARQQLKIALDTG